MLASAPADSRILDVGAAAGYLDRELQARGHRVTAIEQNAARADQARPYCEELIVGDVESLDLRSHAGEFDYLVLGDVLEHLKDPSAALARLLETLKPGGRILACVPNVANLYVRFKLMMGKFEYEPRGIMDASHLRFYTLRGLRELVQGAGLEIE